MARNKANQTQMLPEEWRASTSLAGVYALRMLGMFLVLPVLALYAAQLPDANDNKALVGLAMGMYGLTQALLQLPLGMASDKFGRKKVIYFGLIVFAAGSFMAAAANSLEMLVLARAVQGAGAVSAAVTALLADLTRDEVRTRSMAMIGLSIGLTFSASLVLSPMLAGWMGVSGLFALTGGLTLLSMAVVAFWTPNPERSKVHEDAQAQPARFGEVLKNRQLMSLNFGIFAFIVGETRDKLKQVFLLGIGLTLVATLGLMLGYGSLWLIAACLIVYFIGFNILEASQPSMVSKIAPAKLKGTAMGVYNTLQSIGLFCGGLLGGRLLEHYGFMAVFGFVALLMLLWLLIAARTPAPKPVKNLAWTLGKTWQGRQEALHSVLKDLAGVEQISFSADGETVYMKVLQKGFDEMAAKKIISGVE